MTAQNYAVIFARTSGEQIIVAPKGPSTVVRRRGTAARSPWIPLRDDSGEPIAYGPVAVVVTKTDAQDLEENGWGKSLAQKLVRAIEKAERNEPLNSTTVRELRRMVEDQDPELAGMIVDGRKKRAKKPAPTPAPEPVEEIELGEEELQDSLRAGDAAGGSTHLLVPSKELGENYVPREVSGVQDLSMLDYAREKGENVLLHGPTQSGKTYLPIAYAALRSMPCYSVPGTVALEPSQLFGKYVPDHDGGFRWVDGPVTSLVRNGGVLVLDEINTISPKIAPTLYSLLDQRREISLLDHEGEVIRAHKNLLVVATCNIGYQGTLPMSEALLDRFNHRHHWDYSEEVEKKLITSSALLNLARDLRNEGSLRAPFSTSLMKTFEELATSRLGWDYAVANLLGRFTDPEDQETVRSLMDINATKIQEQLGLREAPEPEPEPEPEDEGDDLDDLDDGGDVLPWSRLLKEFA